MQANGRLQRWNSRGVRPQGWVEAAARKLPRGALGMDALTTEGYAGKRQAEHCKGFKVLRVWKLANGRLERRNNRGYLQANGRLQRWNSRCLRPQGWVEAAARKRDALGMDALTTEGYAGKRHAATLEQQGRTATGLGGSCREEAAARRPWHGRPNNRGLCRQTAGCKAGTAGAYGHRAGWKLPWGSCHEAP